MGGPAIVRRDVPPRTLWALEQAGVPPLLARLFAARGVSRFDELDDGLGRLLPPGQLKGATDAARSGTTWVSVPGAAPRRARPRSATAQAVAPSQS